MNANTYFLSFSLIIFSVFILVFYGDELLVESLRDWTDPVSQKKSFRNPGYIAPWQVPKGVNKDSFTFENGICDPQALPPSWRRKRKLVLGFIKRPVCPVNEFMVIINSAPKNIELRNVQREYFKQLPNSHLYSVYFILGRTDVELEDSEDIVIGDFKDSYENLVLKTKSAYEYFESCEKPKYFLIQDDDVWSNIGEMMEILSNNENRTIFGAVLPRMDVMSGWAKRKGIYIEHEIWPYWKWPKYIYGAATFMRREAAVAISEAASTSEDIIYIPIEDAVFTGVLRIKACVGIEHMPDLAVHYRGKINLLKEKIDSVLKYS